MNKQIIIEHIRRRGVLIGLMSIVQLAFSVGQLLSPRHTLATPILLLFIGPVFLSMDLAKGLARPTLLLPIDRKTVARTWWLIGVGLPSIWGLILLLLGSVIASFWAPDLRTAANSASSILSLRTVCVTTILFFSSLSVAYFALTGLPTNVEEAKKWSGKSGLFGALWGFSIGGSIMLANILNDTPRFLSVECIGLLGAGLGFTVWGYLRTEDMLTSRSTGRSLDPSKSTRLDKPLFEINSSQTGFSHLTRTTIAQVLGFGAFFFVAVVGIQWFTLGTLSMKTSLTGFGRMISILESQAAIFVAMPLFFLASKLTAARVFRTLPLTASELSNHLFRLMATLIFIQASVPALFVAFSSYADESVRLFCFYFFIGGFASLCMPIVLRWGLRPATFALIMPIFALSPLINLWIPKSSQPLPLLCLAIVSVLVARQLTEKVFKTSSDAYKHVHQNPMMSGVYGRN